MTKRRPGRPSVDGDDQSVYVGVTLTAAQYDELCKTAIREDVSLPEVIRRELTANKHLKTPTR
jgi:hypothetical protein